MDKYNVWIEIEKVEDAGSMDELTALKEENEQLKQQ
jgi:hypothetical protein